jgi:hypothetical protein
MDMETIRCSESWFHSTNLYCVTSQKKSSSLHSHSHENIKCRLTTKFITRIPCMEVGEVLVYIV